MYPSEEECRTKSGMKKVGRGMEGRKAEGKGGEEARLSTKAFARAGMDAAKVW